jgi:excisionase family DNA binding protein
MVTHTGPAFMSVAQAAERLGVSRRTAYNLIRDEGLPVVVLRGMNRVPVGALEQWIVNLERRSLETTP